jgi:hypothetical protein
MIAKGFKYAVSFRVRHPSINSKDICRELGMKATRNWTAGHARSTPRGQSLPGINQESYATFDLKNRTNIGLAKFLHHTNRRLLKKRKFLNKIYSTGGSLEYFIGWFSDKMAGEVFDTKLLKETADLHIDIALSVYPP